MTTEANKVQVTVKMNDEVLTAPLSALMVFGDSRHMRSICKVVITMVKMKKTKKSFDLTGHIHVDITLKY